MRNPFPMPLRAVAVLVTALAIGLWLVAAAMPAEVGIASVYSTKTGTQTASGIKLNDSALTAAHRTLPFGTKVKVTNTRNGKSVEVVITDRGPFIAGRVIDLTPAGASAIGFSGLAPVNLTIIEMGKANVRRSRRAK